MSVERRRAASVPLDSFTTLDTIERYLPRNYTALQVNDDTVIISGYDSAGWTLDDYVIPRLASGLIFATELDVDA